MKNLKTLLVSLLILIGNCNFAQDIHFSQVGFSPLTLNPALTGASGAINGLINYRSQWASVAKPYNTMAASFDMRVMESKNGIFAVGLNFFNDQSGESRINQNSVNLHLAYHMFLNDEHSIGVGIYGGWGQNALTLNDDKWGVQYDGAAYDGSIGSGEIFSRQSFSYIDAGTGIVYSFNDSRSGFSTDEGKRVNAGIAIYHVNEPSYSFVAAANDKLNMRMSGFADALITLNGSRNSIRPGAYVNFQNGSKEIVLGTYYRYMATQGSQITGFKKPLYLSLGGFYRFGDAFITKFMAEFHEYSLGLAYDFNVSNLSTFSRSLGGFELFLRYALPQLGGMGTKARI